jgi:hypothetical protein
MRYKNISKKCVEILSDQGYDLSEGDRSFIDELTMMVLTENSDGDCTDEELVHRIIHLGKLHLDPEPEEEDPVELELSAREEGSAQGLWDSVVQFFSSMKQGPKE